MGSNPKHPQLLGYAISALWTEVKFCIKILQEVHKLLNQRENEYKEFRNKWGMKPPSSEKHWLHFWQEFNKLEDLNLEISNSIIGTERSLNEAAESAFDIIRRRNQDQDYQFTNAAQHVKMCLDRIQEIEED